MNLRQATLRDVPAVMAVIRKVVPLMRAAGNLQWDDAYPNPDVFARDIAKAQLWVAEIDGAIAGVAAITEDQEPEYARVGWDISEPAIVVHRVAVDPAFRGRGVAEALMRQAEDVAARRGITVLRVDTNTQNQATQKLFPKLGYTLSGETELGFRVGLRFLCYEKRLA
jgi:ribosomal protein S18 acetylase RimI-like enzyme